MSHNDPQDLGQICIQFHPHRAPGLDTGRLRQACEDTARKTDGVRGIGFTDGDDGGPYLNITFASSDPRRSWPLLRKALLDSEEFGAALSGACMCVCTGEDGWNDYLLLHHFDPGATPDDLGGDTT